MLLKICFINISRRVSIYYCFDFKNDFSKKTFLNSSVSILFQICFYFFDNLAWYHTLKLDSFLLNQGMYFITVSDIKSIAFILNRKVERIVAFCIYFLKFINMYILCCSCNDFLILFFKVLLNLSAITDLPALFVKWNSISFL